MIEATIEDLVYAAGFMDGEGTFVCYDKNKGRCHPGVRAEITYQPTLVWLAERFGGHVSQPRMCRLSKKPTYYWAISGVIAVEFTRALLPFLREKYGKAKELLSIWTYRRSILETNYELLKCGDVPIDLIYAAAFMDGEGSFMCKSKSYCNPRVQAIVTYLPTLEWLRAEFGGGITVRDMEKTRKWRGALANNAHPDKWKQAYHWYIDGMAAAEFTSAILPYLKEKHDRAEELLGRWTYRKRKLVEEGYEIVKRG